MGNNVVEVFVLWMQILALKKTAEMVSVYSVTAANLLQN